VIAQSIFYFSALHVFHFLKVVGVCHHKSRLGVIPVDNGWATTVQAVVLVVVVLLLLLVVSSYNGVDTANGIITTATERSCIYGPTKGCAFTASSQPLDTTSASRSDQQR
jgi:uncharacterized membrane protein